MLTVGAEDRNLSNAVDFSEFLDGDVVEDLVQLRLREVARDRVLNNRRISKGPGKNLRFDGVGKDVRQFVDRELNLLLGRFNICAVGELSGDL